MEFRKELTPVIYTSAAIKVHHFNVGPKHSCFRMHWHDRMETIRVKSGELDVKLGTVNLKVNSGDVLILPPKTPHMGVSGNSSLQYDVLSFDVRSFYNETEICQRFLPSLFEGRAKLKPLTTDSAVRGCIDAICNSDDKDSLEITAAVYNLFYLLFSRIVTEIREEENKNFIREITEYIEEHFSEELSTDEIAAHFGYSEAHFCRKFKKEMGLTPLNYLRIYRLETAQKMIEKGINISQIAASCGFPDSNYFTRCFKAHFGVPPTAFRK